MQLELNIANSIIETTAKIEDNYPELLKFIDEMPLTILNEGSPEINAESLQNYQESLSSLLSKYEINHQNKKK